MTDTTIIPFTAAADQEALDDLRDRLARTRFARGISSAGWEHGIPETAVRDLAERWATSFDWRAWEARLNAVPQFTTRIDGQPIHFLHARSPRPDAMPLMLIHGWPGSVLEFLEVIEPLTNPGDKDGGEDAQAFHVVVPSIPGFGFSGPTTDAGWNTGRIAAAFIELMRRLGYERYGIQGGDLGAFIAPEMARQASDAVTGVHVNAATFGFIPFGAPDENDLATLTETERARLERLDEFTSDGSGYFQIQSTRPQTLAYGLTDSPVGQLAWIAEKFHDWAEPKGSIDPDFVLASTTLYWLTETAGSSARLYWESMHSDAWPSPVTTRTGVACFANDVAIRRYAEDGFKITHWSDFDRGGHFPAVEAPDLLVADIRNFFTV